MTVTTEENYGHHHPDFQKKPRKHSAAALNRAGLAENRQPKRVDPLC